jgi:hypothetical protein
MMRRDSKRVETKSLAEDEQSQHERSKNGVPSSHPNHLPNTPCRLPIMSTHCVEVDDSKRDLEESVKDLPDRTATSRPYRAKTMALKSIEADRVHIVQARVRDLPDRVTARVNSPHIHVHQNFV